MPTTDDRLPNIDEDQPPPVGKVKGYTEKFGDNEFHIEYDTPGAKTYYPLCGVTDTTMAYIFFSIVCTCATFIILLCIFSWITLPILING